MNDEVEVEVEVVHEWDQNQELSENRHKSPWHVETYQGKPRSPEKLKGR